MNVVSSQDGVSSLMVASLNGHVEVVDELLQHRAKVDLQTEVITMLIHVYICVCSYTWCVVFIQQNNDTALMFACQKNNLTTVFVLLKAGAYPNICNKVMCNLTHRMYVPQGLFCACHLLTM